MRAVASQPGRIWTGTGREVHSPRFLAQLAEGLVATGQYAAGLATIDDALTKAERGGEKWRIPHLLRIKGDLRLQAADSEAIPAGRARFLSARDTAREQDALFWELGIAQSLARLRLRQRRREEARASWPKSAHGSRKGSKPRCCATQRRSFGNSHRKVSDRKPTRSPR